MPNKKPNCVKTEGSLMSILVGRPTVIIAFGKVKFSIVLSCIWGVFPIRMGSVCYAACSCGYDCC